MGAVVGAEAGAVTGAGVGTTANGEEGNTPGARVGAGATTSGATVDNIGAEVGADAIGVVVVAATGGGGSWKIGAAVVGSFVGPLDGAPVQVGPTDWNASSLLEGAPEGASETDWESTGAIVVGVLVGILDGEIVHEGWDEPSMSTGLGPILGASDINLYTLSATAYSPPSSNDETVCPSMTWSFVSKENLLKNSQMEMYALPS
jgi:hypothetical protein